MKEYLIKYFETRAKELNMSISELYAKVGELYQKTYGVNIVAEAEDKEIYDIVDYLDSFDITDDGFKMRYIALVNKL